jgi:hypothetical protein
METAELLIELNGNRMVGSFTVDGVVRQRAAFSQKEGEVLIAWLEKHATGRVHVRLHVSGTSEMRLALELASMLARAGHTISLGESCRFRPAKPAAHENFT